MLQLSEIDSSYDVIAIGGGPSGAAAATLLQKYGHKCLVIERATFPRYHIGESLIPHTYGTLKRLGLLEHLKKSHFPVKHSVRFVSSSGHDADPFYFSETIKSDAAQTWQVERSEFDQLCLNNARAAGVDVLMNTRVDQVLFDGDTAVGVRVSDTEEQSREIHASVIVDASGRKTVIGKQLNLLRPVPGLNKTSIWGYYKGGKRRDGIDAGETTIFMLPTGGWFWYIPLPDDMVSVGIVDSPKNLEGPSTNYNNIFNAQVEACKPLNEWLEDATLSGSVRGIPTLAYRNSQTAGNGWVMIGDAAAFLDPIYSSGLFLALASAELAADTIHDALTHNDLSPESLGAFAPALSEGIDVIRWLIHAFYDSTFSFKKFTEQFPEHRAALIDCLVGDVVAKDMTPFLEALRSMTPAPPPLQPA